MGGSPTTLNTVQGGFWPKLYMVIPKLDTVNNPAKFYPGAITIRPQDTLLTDYPPIYMSNGRFWISISSGAGQGIDSITVSTDSTLYQAYNQGNQVFTFSTLLRHVRAGANVYFTMDVDTLVLNSVTGGTGNGLVSVGGLVLSDSTLYVQHDIVWRISNVLYTRTTDTFYVIPSADTNYYRKDVIYIDSADGSFNYLQGTQDTVIAYPPVVPAGGIIVTIVDVFGPTITQPVPFVVNGYWATAGNLGTNPVTDGVGTLDSVDLKVITKGIPRIIIKANGGVSVNEGATTSTIGDQLFQVVNSTGLPYIQASTSFKGGFLYGRDVAVGNYTQIGAYGVGPVPIAAMQAQKTGFSQSQVVVTSGHGLNSLITLSGASYIRLVDSSLATASNGYVWTLTDAPDGTGAWKPSSGSAGTVTSVSRTNGLGILASVANPTTTPDISISVDTSNVSILSRQRAAATYAPIGTLPIGGSYANFYLKDSTLSSRRTVNGGGFGLTFNNLSGIAITADSININDNIVNENTGLLTIKSDDATSRLDLSSSGLAELTGSAEIDITAPAIVVNGYTLPASIGTTGQVLTLTDNFGTSAWQASGLSSYLPLAGGTMSGDILMGGTSKIAVGGAVTSEPVSIYTNGNFIGFYDASNNLQGQMFTSTGTTARQLLLNSAGVTGAAGVADSWLGYRFGGASNKVFFGDDGTNSYMQANHPLKFSVTGSHPTTAATSDMTLSSGSLLMNAHLIFTDNTYDIGANGATRPRTGYFGTSLITPLINKVTITAPTSAATLTLVDGSSLITSGAFATTLTATGTTNVTLPTSGTLLTTTGSGTGLTGVVLSGSTNVITAASAASTPVIKYTGAVFTGGTGTTTMPHVLIEDAAATPASSWSTNGTLLGGNAVSGFSGDFFNFKVNSAARTVLSASGNLAMTAGNLTIVAGNATISAGNLTVTAGKALFGATLTAGGTTGNQTINKPSGSVNIAAAGTTVTVTNSLVTTSSLVYAWAMTNDATAQVKNVTVASGSFVINTVAVTAETKFGFVVFN
jgi:hypothetical protein